MYVIIFSSFITFSLTFTQLYLEYTTDIKALDNLARQIRSGYMKSITEATWHLDKVQLQNLLEGIAALPDVAYANIVYNDVNYVEAGIKPLANSLSYQWEMDFTYYDKKSRLGYLNVVLSKEQAIASLKQRLILVLALNFMRTFLVALFILYIVQFLITRHLTDLSNILTGLKSLDETGENIKLQGKRDLLNRNELDVLVQAISIWYQTLRSLWGALQLSENNHRQLLENLNYAVLIIAQDQAVFCNRKFLSYFEQESAEDIDLEPFLGYRALADNSLTGENLEGAALLDYIAKAASEEFELSRKPVHNKVSFLQGFVSLTVWDQQAAHILFFIDATEKKQLEQQTRQQHLKLIQMDKMNTLGIMASSITHEINNPNHRIRMSLELIDAYLSQWVDAVHKAAVAHESDHALQRHADKFLPMLLEALQVANRASLDIENIIFSLKDFMGGRASSQKQLCDLRDIIWNAIRMVEPHAIKHGFITRFEHESSEPPELVCHKILIQQVFVNILINAVEAANRDRRKAIHIELQLTDTHVCVRIRDNGEGIPEEQMGQIFELFSSSKQQQGGTGIGMALVHSIVTDHQAVSALLARSVREPLLKSVCLWIKSL
ncbi:MAG: ATP-binding protein [Thiolinea sp.]